MVMVSPLFISFLPTSWGVTSSYSRTRDMERDCHVRFTICKCVCGWPPGSSFTGWDPQGELSQQQLQPTLWMLLKSLSWSPKSLGSSLLSDSLAFSPWNAKSSFCVLHWEFLNRLTDMEQFWEISANLGMAAHWIPNFLQAGLYDPSRQKWPIWSPATIQAEPHPSDHSVPWLPLFLF